MIDELLALNLIGIVWKFGKAASLSKVRPDRLLRNRNREPRFLKYLGGVRCHLPSMFEKRGLVVKQE